MTEPNNGYSSYMSPTQSGSYYGDSSVDNGPQLRRRNVETSASSPSNGNNLTPRSRGSVVKKLDFMFPKVDTEYTVRTDGGGMASLIAYGLILVLLVTETLTWLSANGASTEHIMVDTSLGKRMRLNLNITFPALACEDLHLDVMDVAGDAQLNVEDTLSKIRLDLLGNRLTSEVIEVKSNAHHEAQKDKERILKEELPENYCGPCYGAQAEEGQCCNTCDELLDAYKARSWRTDILLLTSEQCIREGRDKKEAKPLVEGEGCNLSGYMTLNRVSGNFHVAMGEGVERDGRHIHTYDPDEAHTFNASHIIHHLSFGPPGNDGEDGHALDGVTKIVTKQHGTTGFFQYFIKVVPTTYVGKGGESVETNRFFFTERFRPLMKEYIDDEHKDEEKDGDKAAVAVGGSGSHSHHSHHSVRNSVLPGVFFMYEIYPFAVEVSKNSVPFTHLLIRIMATIGGVFTIVRWVDSFLFERNRKERRKSNYLR